MYYRLWTILFLFISYSIFSETKSREPDFTLKNLRGESVSLSMFSQKIVLIEWYSFWCDECREVFHDIKSFFHELNKVLPEKSFQLLAINIDDKEEKEIAEFVEFEQIFYTVLLDPEGTTADVFDIKGLPYFAIIGKQGRVEKTFKGFDKTTKEAIRKTLLSLIE